MRLTGILLGVIAAAAGAVATWPGFFHLERAFPVAQAIAFRGILTAVLGVLAVVLLLGSLSRRMRRLLLPAALVVLVAAVSNGAILASRGLGESALPEKTEASLRVMTWNTAGDHTDPAVVAQTAVAMGADIVALPETTIDAGERVAVAMRELGRPMWAHHTEYGSDGWAADSTTLLISPALGDYAVVTSTSGGVANTSTVPSIVAMPVSGDGPVVVGAHAVAPRRDDMTDWRHDLQWLADQCGSDDVVIAGDFNATVDHMSGLGTGGAELGRCRDAAAATGNGAVGTWPAVLPPLAGAPIDHVLATANWTPAGSVVLDALDDAGGDHRPLVVQLERTG